MFDKSFLRKSGQGWKLIVGICLIMVGGIFFSFPIISPKAIGDEGRYVMIFPGIGFSMLGLIFSIFSIRCPKCNEKLFWHAISRKASSSWLAELLGATGCPKCGFSYDHTK